MNHFQFEEYNVVSKKMIKTTANNKMDILGNNGLFGTASFKN